MFYILYVYMRTYVYVYLNTVLHVFVFIGHRKATSCLHYDDYDY